MSQNDTMAMQEAQHPVAAANWQPIETAPRDGTRFLAICDTGLIRLVRFDYKYDRLPIGDEPGSVWPTAPTHWAPWPTFAASPLSVAPKAEPWFGTPWPDEVVK